MRKAAAVGASIAFTLARSDIQRLVAGCGRVSWPFTCTKPDLHEHGSVCAAPGELYCYFLISCGDQAPTKTCQMVQTKNVQAVTAAAMTPVIRAGRVNPVDWDMMSALQ
jgi:hypothetical protein